MFVRIKRLKFLNAAVNAAFAEGLRGLKAHELVIVVERPFQ